MIADHHDVSPTASAGGRIARDTVELAATGDHDAWDRIFRTAYPRLYAFASGRVGFGSADDVVSETMVRAVAGITRYRWTDAGIEAWLFGIARHVVADHHRATGRRRRWSHRLGESTTVGGPAELLETKDEHRHIRELFAQLPAKDREVLELRLIAGLSPEQVAVAIGKRPGAVRTAQSRALRRLREGLERR